MQNAIAVIHSNFGVLTAVLDDVKSHEVSEIVVRGDPVGDMPASAWHREGRHRIPRRHRGMPERPRQRRNVHHRTPTIAGSAIPG